jgi:rhamnogalacturonan acetylesterase
MRALALAVALSFSLFAPAQAPQATPDAPPQTDVPVDAPLNPALPTVFIVGDSTARNKSDLGWGDHFAPLFDTTRINVANRAVAGRSSRSYINEGRWDKVLAEMKPGDFVLFQMAHNDDGELDSPKRRATIKSLGEETQAVPYTEGPKAGQIETVHTYGWYMRKYIAETRAKGATPILLTPTIRNIWTTAPDGTSHIERDMGYRALVYQLAAAEHVPVADMATIEADHLESLGPAKTAPLFPIDHTHTNPVGADMNAHAVAAALRKTDTHLKTYLRPEAK